MRKLPLFLLAALVLVLGAAFAGIGRPLSAEPNPPSPSPAPKTAPAIDGVVKDGEYPLFFDLAPFKVWVARSGDVIRFAVSAKTKGWIALGVDSKIMDGAAMFMGEVKDGKAVLSEQTGSGHGHSDTPADKRIATKFAVKTDGGVTTMELECPAAKVVAADAKELPVILAYAASDNLRDYHAARRSATLKLE